MQNKMDLEVRMQAKSGDLLGAEVSCSWKLWKHVLLLVLLLPLVSHLLLKCCCQSMLAVLSVFNVIYQHKIIQVNLFILRR